METERTLLDRLNKRYGITYRNGSYVGRRYSRAEHVRSSVGFDARRIADYIAVDCFSVPFRERTDAEKLLMQTNRADIGGSIHGFEIKTSRADWLSELADPSKAHEWGKHCHYFWLVVPNKTVVRDDLPEGWGLLMPSGASLRASVKAVRRDVEPMPTTKVAALSRAITKTELKCAREIY